MAPLNYQQQHDRHLEDGLVSHGDEKLILKEELAARPQLQASSPPKARKMNLRRFTVTFGVGLLVGFGLVTASRTRPHRALCSQEVHASNEHEMKALVEQTKDDASALSEMLRCASPETFHKLVSVYFPDRSKPEADDSRSAAIGKDETWLLTAWEKLVKRQDDGTGNPATPSDSATEGAGDAASGSATLTNPDPGSSDPASNDDTSVTRPGSDPEPTSSDLPADSSSSDPASDPSSSDPVSQPPPNTDTDAAQSTTMQQPPPSSTSEELPESTSEEPITSEEPSTSESVAPETTSTSSEESSTSTEEAPSTTSSSTQEQPKPSTSSEVLVPSSSSSSSSFKEPTSTLPKETSTEHDEPDKPSKTTIHVSSSAVRQTITSVNEDGGVTTITSTSWVAVDPPKPTDDNESDPSLQDAGLSLRANVAPAAFVGAIVAALLVT